MPLTHAEQYRIILENAALRQEIERLRALVSWSEQEDDPFDAARLACELLTARQEIERLREALENPEPIYCDHEPFRQEIERLRKIEVAAQKWEKADAAYDPDDEYEMTLYAEWVHAATDLRAALTLEPGNG